MNRIFLGNGTTMLHVGIGSEGDRWRVPSHIHPGWYIHRMKGIHLHQLFRRPIVSHTNYQLGKTKYQVDPHSITKLALSNPKASKYKSCIIKKLVVTSNCELVISADLIHIFYNCAMLISQLEFVNT